MDHLGSGKEWDLHTRNNGLFILPPFLTRENGGEYSGRGRGAAQPISTICAVRTQPYVILIHQRLHHATRRLSR